MTAIKWRNVAVGTTVELKGRDWKVDKLKVKNGGKLVKVTVSSKLGTFAREMRGKDEVNVVMPAERWASKKAAAKAEARRESVEAERRPDIRPVVMPATTPSKADWETSEDRQEAKIRKHLDGKLLAIEIDGTYVMPEIDPSTLAAHLLVFHGLTTTGATVAEARTLERTHTAEAALKVVEWERLKTLHDSEHEKMTAGTAAATVPHVHTKTRPAS